MTRAPGIALAAASLGAWAPVARAEPPRQTPAAIEVDRDAAPGGRASLGFDGGEPVDAWGASLSLGWIERPIALPAGALGAGSPASRPVRRRETLALGGAIAVGDRIVVDAVLRGSHQVGDRLAAAGDPGTADHLARFAAQDVRLGLRIRVAGDDDRAALLRGELTLPTGDDAQFAGDAAWTAAWSLIGRIGLPRGAALAATAAIRLHGAEVAVGNRVIGDELVAAVGGELPLPALGIPAGGVALRAAVLAAVGDRIGDAAGASPAEARLGARVQILPELWVTGDVGVGLDDQIGAPRLRAIASVAWTPRAPHEPGRAPPPSDDTGDDPDDP